MRFDDHFASLANWNYGVTDFNTSGSPTAPGYSYYPWYASGSAPYWGSAVGTQEDDYGFPGNIWQTSTGPNAALYTTYSPQIFNPSGYGVSITCHYVGSTSTAGFPYHWSAGHINNYGKGTWPTGYSEYFYQVNMQCGGGGSDLVNGSWAASWFLGQTSEGYEVDLQEFGLNDLGEANPSYYLNSTVHTSTVNVDYYGTASYNIGSSLSAGYHVYGLHYIPGTSINFYVDNVVRGPGYSGSAVTQQMFNILSGGLAVGTSPTDTYRSSWSSTADMITNIQEVQCYAR
jgi:hypothetical protein